MTKTSYLLAALAVTLGLVLVLPNMGGGNLQKVPTSVLMYDGGSATDSEVVEEVTPGPGTSLRIAAKLTDLYAEKVRATDDPAKENCGYADAKAGFKPEFNAQVISVRKRYRFDLDEEFRVKVYVKNAGNTAWFSTNSTCAGAKVSLVTARDEGRVSTFYAPNIEKSDNNWDSASRIVLDDGQMRVDPGEIASFTFWSKATSEPSVYREFFVPYLEGIGALEDAEMNIDVFSGETGETASDLRKKLMYTYKSMSANNVKIDGERRVEVDLSDQRLYLKLDDYVVREFIVSTGAPGTPTPVGTFGIFIKNEIRVGHSAPHYIMPRFQMFTPQGAGLHALPSLSNDGGTFWTEALDHLGTPASHGCVRMSPDDADFTFAFTELGDKIDIHY